MKSWKWNIKCGVPVPVTKSKVVPLTTQQPIRVTRCWGKENDIIQKASKLIRWQTSVLKNHLNKVQNSHFFYVKGMGGKWEGREVIDNHRYLGTSRGPSKIV